MIVERELEIEAFKTREYWTHTAEASAQGLPFKAKLTHFNGEKLNQFSFTGEEQARQVKQALLEAADGRLIPGKAGKKTAQSQSGPAFYYLYLAAGSRPETGIYHQAHHDGGAAIV